MDVGEVLTFWGLFIAGLVVGLPVCAVLGAKLGDFIADLLDW
jgi:hypothetical protein